MHCRSDEIGIHARLKIVCRKACGFKSHLRHLKKESTLELKKSYIIGVALGDGNLSNPNNRATRLRITCDNKYPQLIEHIKKTLMDLFPNNKVNLIDRITCKDISVYSNSLEEILGWKVGSKDSQSATIPKYIMENKRQLKECLRGLFQTDGSIYIDRGYKMINFTNKTKVLCEDVYNSLKVLGFSPQIRKSVFKEKTKYIVRLSKDQEKFISEINLWKK